MIKRMHYSKWLQNSALSSPYSAEFLDFAPVVPPVEDL